MFRSFYGLAPLRTNSGIPTQAVYGFYKTVQKLITKFGPDKILVAWDSRKNVRREKFESYKANRAAFPDELAIQREYIIKIADKIQLAQLELEGFEADDIIATAAKKFSNSSVCIVSSDKDLLQLVDGERITQFDPAKDKHIDAKGAEEIYGFGPDKIRFYHSLLGDSSDNIPGAKGIGKKTAFELVNQFSGLDDLYAHLDKVEKPRTRKLLEEGKDQVYLSSELFKLLDCPVDLGLEDLSFDQKNWALASDIFKELEFKAFVSHQPSRQLDITSFGKQTAEPDYSWLDYKIVSDKKALQDLTGKIKSAKVMAFDLETTGFNARHDNIVALSLAYGDKTAFYLPVGHDDPESQQLSMEELFQALNPLFKDPEILKIAQNAKFDIHFLHSVGFEVAGKIFDTMVAARLVRPEWKKVNLESLCQEYLDITTPSYKELFSGYENFSKVPIKVGAPYGASDAICAFKLKNVLEQKLEAEGSQKLFDVVETPALDVIIEMEETGIRLCTQTLAKIRDKIGKQLETIEGKIRATLESLGVQEPEKVNLLSPKQVEGILFDVIKLEPIIKKRGGKRSTSKDVLDDLAKTHPVPGMILEYRKLSKLLNTYLDALPKEVEPETGKIYTTFWQTRVATGRLASSDPNLQNIPPQVREAFVAGQGYSFIAADYSQIELRVLAHLSQDENLLKAFKDDLDVHAQTAGQIFGCQPGEVTKEQRQVGKRINFSVIYGLSAFSLSRELDIPRGKAQEYIDAFFEQYKGVATWMGQVADQAKEAEFTTTMAGRRRHVPGINDRNKAISQAAQRAAINSVVQGTASEIIKMAMAGLKKEISRSGLDAKIILQVHDELLLEAKDCDLETAKTLTNEVMSKVVQLDVPLEVSVKFGKDWGEVSK